ncbi:MAG: hypothetical protein ACE5I3_08390 [Phycisphaerae bacterium]
MTPPSADNPPLPLDDDRHVAVDLPCGKCGYNLRTLSVDGICPECACPVRSSTGARFLRFAPPAWVQQLARGVLLLTIPAGVFAIGKAVVLTPMQGLLPFKAPTGVISPSFRLFAGLDQVVFAAGIMALVMIALWTVTKPNPLPPPWAEGLTARRVLRLCTILLPLPLVLGLLTKLYQGNAIASAPPPAPLFTPSFTALVVASHMTAVTALTVTPLALLCHLGGLMRRVPRPGLARFCRIAFWGSLVSGAALLAGYTWTTVFVVIPMVTTPLTRMPAPAVMAVPIQPPIGLPFTVAWYLSSVGGRAMIGFVIAGLVLLIFVQRALAQAAREAAEIAAMSAGAPSDASNSTGWRAASGTRRRQGM